MATGVSIIYTCTKCGAQSQKWNGRCFECGGWSTLVKEALDVKTAKRQEAASVAAAEIIELKEVKNIQENERLKIGISEADRVFGGGIVPGSLVLLSGEPGIGKSTILAQIANAIGKNGDVIYASGEESATQVKGRLDRLGCDISNIKFVGETNAEKIINAAKINKPKLLIIDSIQTVYSSEVPAEAGGINQIRVSTVKFLELAKEHNIPVILIGHITKDGQVAGPKTLEHIVDTVVYLESDRAHDFRILRATKNRFGSINEIGVFEMTGKGFVEIKNPSLIFMESSGTGSAGSVISCVMEGVRPFLVEIQALVTKTVFGYPQRKASGFDLNRLQVLSAVLTKRGGINLENQDIILNVVGGLKINDPALDLPVCLAIASSFQDKLVSDKTIIAGEVGLGGEVRNVSKLKERLTEAKKLGFDKAITPDVQAKFTGITVKKMKKIDDIAKYLN